MALAAAIACGAQAAPQTQGNLGLGLRQLVAFQQAVLAGLAACPGLRLAEAGEFTRRAFLNGRLDLAQATDLVGALVLW